MRCKHCGTANDDQFKFCESCGTPLRKPLDMVREIKGTIISARVVEVKSPTIDDSSLYPCRWVLSNRKKKHCDACLKFAGEYPSYNAMLEATKGAVPGYFPGWADRSNKDDIDPVIFVMRHFDGIACGLDCRCHIELFIDGQWRRL